MLNAKCAAVIFSPIKYIMLEWSVFTAVYMNKTDTVRNQENAYRFWPNLDLHRTI